MCTKSAYRLNKHYDLLIIDEIHTALSPVYRSIFANISYNQILGLTATVPDDLEYQSVLDLFCPIVFRKTLSDVINKGIVAESRIFNIPVKMNRRDSARYKIFNQQFNRAKMELSILKTTMPHLQGISVFDIAKAFNGDKEKNDLVKYSKMFWSGMTLRKMTCYNAESKIPAVKEILAAFPNKK